MKKKKRKNKTKKLEISFHKIANFTSKSLSKAYEDFKIKEKKELKLREERIVKNKKTRIERKGTRIKK